MNTGQLESVLLSLTEQLEQIKLDKQTIERQEKQLIADIKQLQLSLTPHSKTSSSARSNHRTKSDTPGKVNKHTLHQHLDSQGRIIKVGDVVKFLTYTKFKSFHGRVVRTTKHRIISINYKGSEVVKESRNLKIVPKDTDLKDGYSTP